MAERSAVTGTLSSSYRPLLEVGRKHSHMILNAHPNQGGGIICWWRHTLAEAKEKREEVGANYEEVKQREDKHDKKNLTLLLFMRA